FTAEDSTANDAAQGSCADERSAAERTFPLASDVVRLVRQHARDVGVGSSGGKEDAKVPSAIVAVCPAHDGETNDAKHGVECNTEAPLAVLVSEPSSQDHHNASENIGGSNEALSGPSIKAKPQVEDDREEVCERVAHSRRASEA
ncbi:MAG: hypothetical protein Q9200_003015, partial [Gallowayella weberi]